MFRFTTLVGLGILGVALLVSTGASQDKKDPPKTKGQLPAGWKKLGLSNDQVQQIYGVQGKFKSKINALEDQIKDLRTQERTEMVKLLTAAQKDQLRKMAVGDDDRTEKKSKPPEKDKN